MNKGWQQNYDLGKKTFDEKNYDAAVQYLEQVIREKDTFADVYNMLGLIYYNNSRFEDAITAFKKALAINPMYIEASLNLSVVYNELGQFDKATETYMVAKTAGVGNAESYLDPFVKGKLANMHASLGNIYKDIAYYTEAADEFKRALKLRPDFIDIKTNLAIVYRNLKDYPNAIKELEESLELIPDSTSSRTQLGLTYYMMNQFDRAKAEWLKVLRKNPDDKMAQMYMNLLMTPAAPAL